MFKTSNTIKAAWITASSVIAVAIISGIFVLINGNGNPGKVINTTITANDSSKVKVINNQNDIKGDFVSGDKIVVNKTIKKENKAPMIEAPNAIIVTHNQVGDNTVNVSHISDSMEFKYNGYIIKEIFYPSTGEYGDNILNKNLIQIPIGKYSMKALIPQNQNLVVQISGKKWKYPLFQPILGWRSFDYIMSGGTVTRKFKNVKFGIVDFEFYLQEPDTIDITVFENNSKIATWSKTITVKN